LGAIAAIMLTYPSTNGVFEETVTEGPSSVGPRGWSAITTSAVSTLAMLAIGRVDSMTEVELLEGHATIAERAPGLARLPSARFAAKYAAQLNEAGHSIDWFAAQFPRALRIRPTRLLDWGARSGRRIG